MNRRLWALVLVFCALLNMTVFAAPQDKKLDFAQINLDSESPQGKGIKVKMGTKEDVTLGYRGGRACWVLDPNVADSGSRFIYVDVDDSYIYNLKRYETVKIEVDYYDSGEGSFVIQYANVNNTTGETEYVEPTYTEKWKTHTFYVSGATFENRHNKSYDFAVSLWGTKMGTSLGNVIIGSVKITKLNWKEHFTISKKSTSSQLFYTGDEIDFDIVFSNADRSGGLYEAADVTAEYTVTDSVGDIVWKSSEAFKIGAGNEITRHINFKVDRYDRYKLHIKAVDEGKKLWGGCQFIFGYINSVKGEYLNPRSSLVGVPNRNNLDDYINLGVGNVRDAMTGTRNFHMTGGSFRITPQYREYLRALQKSGITSTVYLMNYGNVLPFSNGERMPQSEESIKEFAEFCQQIALEVKDFTHVYEVWNEWDISGSGFNPTGASPADYVKLLEAVYKALKEVDPEAVVFSMSTSGGQSGFPSLNFLTKAFEAGAAKWSDGVAVHPYSWDKSPKDGRVFDVVKDGVVRLMNEHGMQGKPLYATEIGWASHYYNISDLQQACYLVQNYIMHSQEVDGKPLIDVISVYALNDSGVVRSEREHNFGMLSQGSPKDSYLAISNMNVLLADARVTQVFDFKSGSAYAYRFDSSKHRNAEYLVMWSDNDGETVNVDLGVNSVNVYDIFGNVSQMISDDGKYTFVLSEKPIYVEGNFPYTKEADTGAEASADTASSLVIENSIIEIGFSGKTDKEYKIEADIRGDMPFEVLENTGIKEGKGILKIQTTSAVNGDEFIPVKISDGENVVYDNSLHLQFSAPAEMYITKKYDAKSNSWYLVGNVINNSTVEDITGVMRIISPVSLAEQIGSSQNVIVPKSGQNTIEMKLPNINTQEAMLVNAAFDIGEKGSADSEIKLAFDSAAYTDTPMTVDGKLDEGAWNNASKVVLDSPEQYIGFTTHNDIHTGVDDLSAVARLMWDENNLYLGVNVKDNIHNQPEPLASLWNADGLQIGIVYDPRNKLDYRNFFEAAIGLMADGTFGLQRYSDGNASSEETYYELAIVRDEESKTTTYEFSLPWSEIPGDIDHVTADTELKFSLLINDRDIETRKGAYEYGSGIANGKNSGQFKILHLTRK